LFALVTAAWVDPAARTDVARLVGDRFGDALDVSQHRAVSIIWSLARLALMTPEVDAETCGAAQTVLDGSTERQEPATSVPGPDVVVPAQARAARTPGGLLRRLRWR
jgi:hypothetical protein